MLTRFHYALRPSGVLVLGKSELIPFAAKLFEPVDLARRIYRRTAHRRTVVDEDVRAADPDRSAQTEAPDDANAATELHHDVLNGLRTP